MLRFSLAVKIFNSLVGNRRIKLCSNSLLMIFRHKFICFQKNLRNNGWSKGDISCKNITSEIERSCIYIIDYEAKRRSIKAFIYHAKNQYQHSGTYRAGLSFVHRHAASCYWIKTVSSIFLNVRSLRHKTSLPRFPLVEWGYLYILNEYLNI